MSIRVKAGRFEIVWLLVPFVAKVIYPKYFRLSLVLLLSFGRLGFKAVHTENVCSFAIEFLLLGLSFFYLFILSRQNKQNIIPGFCISAFKCTFWVKLETNFVYSTCWDVQLYINFVCTII